jgi:predicted small secreted protein
MRLVLIYPLICAVLVSACATVPDGAGGDLCKQAGGSHQLQAELLFGRDINGRGPVTDAERASFMADVVTPRFPDGLTTWDTRGQWRDAASGKTIQEDSFVIRIVAAETPETLTRLGQIRSAYTSQFHQDAVGLLFSRTCASF